MNTGKSYYFCGIGGSGMLPLAVILAGRGARVAGSDRTLDQGRLAAKFAWLEARGIPLFAQDGSGLVSGDQMLIASAAIEDSVADVVKARTLGCARMTRAELLAQLFNASHTRIGVGGTSGKSTVTGMTGWILTACGRDPTIMNGAVMANFADDNAPFASARVGGDALFVSEVDESDGSIALFAPTIAIVNNISLDHKSMAELRTLFGDFARRAEVALFNADDAETRALADRLALPGARRFGFAADADYRASDVVEAPLSVAFTLSAAGETHRVTLCVPGRHNVANALAAIGAAHLAGVPLAKAALAAQDYAGLKRRFEWVGEKGGICVIDDFGHNPDKIAATLRTLKAFPGRLILFFQPHGFGPLKIMGKELTETFRQYMGPEDRLILSDPVYFGGTTDRSVGSEAIVAPLRAAGLHAEHIPDRDTCGARIMGLAQAGDRIVIMGARDDTLSQFARDILNRLD